MACEHVSLIQGMVLLHERISALIGVGTDPNLSDMKEIV
jgi:hypothetical protein